MTSSGKQLTITREMLTAVARDQKWPDVVARFSKFAFVWFCYITNHLIAGVIKCRCILRYCHAHKRVVGVQDRITAFYRVENKEQVSSYRRLHHWSLFVSLESQCFPRLVSGNIEILGKQNSLFPSGPVIKCYIFFAW